MNFSAISDASVVGRLCRFPLRAVPRSAVLPVLQGPLRGKKWIVGSGNHGCWLGSYEHEQQRLFYRLVTSGSVVWDIGANVGFYSLLAAMKAKQVVAFEPFPDNVSYLLRHISLNGLTKICVDQSAVSDKVGIATFQLGDNRSTGHLGSFGMRVKTTTIDECEWPRPDLIKVDAEGAEYDILKGGIHLLRTRRPLVFLATHSSELKQHCSQLLRDVGYAVTESTADAALIICKAIN